MRGRRIAVLAVQGAFIEHEQWLARLGCEVVELRQAADARRSFDGLVLPGGESTVQSKLLRELGMFDTLRERIREGMPVLGTCAGLILLAETIREPAEGRAGGPSGETPRGGNPASGNSCGTRKGGTAEGDTARKITCEAQKGEDREGEPASCTTTCSAVEGFRTLPVTVLRNAYGRQLGSFLAEGTPNGSLATELHVTGQVGERPGETIGAGADAGYPLPLPFIRAPRIEAITGEVEPLVSYDGYPVAVRYRNQIGCAFHPELANDPRIYEFFLSLLA